jgi:hypothetical protein
MYPYDLMQLLTRAGRKDLSKAQGAKLMNRILDVIIVVATTLAILDFLSVKTGLAMRSFLGFSGIGTLQHHTSLSKDIAL